MTAKTEPTMSLQRVFPERNAIENGLALAPKRVGVYLLVGFLCFCWLKHEEDEEAPTTVQKHSRPGYNIAALLFFLLFSEITCCEASKDKAERGSDRAGRFEVVVRFGMLSLVAQSVYWSRIVSGLKQEHA
jgi:hypothetical protein